MGRQILKQLGRLSTSSRSMRLATAIIMVLELHGEFAYSTHPTLELNMHAPDNIATPSLQLTMGPAQSHM